MWRCEYSPRALFTTFHFFIAYEWTNSTLVCTGLPRGKRSSLVGTFISYEKMNCFEDGPWNWILSRDVLNIFLIVTQPNLEKLISSKKSLKLFFLLSAFPFFLIPSVCLMAFLRKPFVLTTFVLKMFLYKFCCIKLLLIVAFLYSKFCSNICHFKQHVILNFCYNIICSKKFTLKK